MNRVWRVWDDYWFAPESATNLGFGRLVYCALLFAFFADRDFSAWARVPEIFWVPHGWFAVFELPVLSEASLLVLQRVFKAALALAAIGWSTRASLTVAAGTGGYLLALGQNFGKIGHGEAIAWIVLVVLAVSRSGDALSIDAWLRGRRGAPTPAASGHYRWPVRAIWLVVALILFAAGYSKLYNSGLAWLDPENLATMMVVHQYFHGGRAWTDWGLTLAHYPIVTGGLAVATLVVETAMPLVMFHPWLRAALVPCALAMLIGFPLLLGPFFVLLIGAFIFFVPWDRVAAAAAGVSPAPR